MISESFRRRRLYEYIQSQGEALAAPVIEAMRGTYDIRPCTTCGEGLYKVLRISPRARSVQVKCDCCGRKGWFRATTTELDDVVESYADYSAFLDEVTVRLERFHPGQEATFWISIDCDDAARK